jgi:PTS system sucrose-specific IIC component
MNVSMAKNDLAQQIIDLSGGNDNFIRIFNCMTRVRINYKDESKVDKEGIAKLDGVIGIHEADSFQIIVGTGKSVKIAEEMNKIVGSTSQETEKSAESQGFLKTLASIFVPLLPAIIASGFLQGIFNLIVNNANERAAALGIQATEKLSAGQVLLEQNHLLTFTNILGLLGSATFAYLAIYTGISAARVFKTDDIIGGALGAVTTLPALTGLGLTVGQGGLLGVILGVWIMSKLDALLKKIVPDIVDIVLRPTFMLLLTGVLYIMVLMPVTGWVSDQIINGIMFLINTTGVFGGFILASLFPSLIATGLHHGLSPINMELINQTGTTPINAIQIMSNAGLVGAGLALVLLTKSPKVKTIAKGVIPATFLAVGEPTMYGLVIPSGFGFITASLGAGFGGAMIRFLDVQTHALGAAGMSAIPLIADGKILQYLLSYSVGVIAAFILTFVTGKVLHKSLEIE